MSRIGRKPITVPSGVDVTIDGQTVQGQGPQGRAAAHARRADHGRARATTASCTSSGPNDERKAKELHGLSRTLVANMIVGVTEGYRKSLEIAGTGYRVTAEGHGPRVRARASRTRCVVAAPDGITFTVERPTLFHVAGIDKQQVGEVAANIRKIRPPEPYKGKGVQVPGRGHPPQGWKGR